MLKVVAWRRAPVGGAVYGVVCSVCMWGRKSPLNLWNVQQNNNTSTMLYLIGLGLGDETDITVKGLSIVKKASRVYLEAYTSILLVDKSVLVRLPSTPPNAELTLMCSRSSTMAGT
jgi:Tetrapyrrole (Corrin/Porphyrin) Methylases